MAVNRTSKARGKILDIPTAPTIGAATGGAGSASVAFTSATVGGPAFSYTALSNPGSITGTGTTSPITVSGLTAGTSYTFTVRGTNPSGNSEYTSASNSVVPTAATAFESIATQEVTTTANSITFSAIPNTFTHLQIRGISSGTRNDYRISEFGTTFNGDSGNNYSASDFYGNGTGAALQPTVLTSVSNIRLAPGTQGANAGGTARFGAVIIDILDYANTNKYKVFRANSGVDVVGSYNGLNGRLGMTGGTWLNTSAITSITLTCNLPPFIQYTKFALYGIKVVS